MWTCFGQRLASPRLYESATPATSVRPGRYADGHGLGQRLASPRLCASATPATSGRPERSADGYGFGQRLASPYMIKIKDMIIIIAQSGAGAVQSTRIGILVSGSDKKARFSGAAASSYINCIGLHSHRCRVQSRAECVLHAAPHRASVQRQTQHFQKLISLTHTQPWSQFFGGLRVVSVPLQFARHTASSSS